MSSRWKNIKEAIYNHIDGKGPGDGYLYTWDTGRRVDRVQDTIASITESPAVDRSTLIIQYPNNGTPFETDVTATSKGVSSLESRKRRRVWLIARVESKLTAAVDEDVIDGNNDALDDALEDITKRALNGTIEPAFCAHGVKKITYVNAFKRALSAKGVYYPYELQIIYDIDYVDTI